MRGIDVEILLKHCAHAWRCMLEYWRAGGWPLIPLALVALLMFYRYVKLWAGLKEALSTPNGSIKDLQSRAADGADCEEMRRQTETVCGAMARIARHTFARMGAGLSVRDAFGQCREAELSRYSHSFCILAGLVAAAPLLGLLGTVLGMVETFDAVGHGNADTADRVAAGISKALITTQVGLAAALPGTFGLAHLRRLLRRLENEIDHWQTHLSIIFRAP
jgi:biopolymer transport protein ExbB